MNARTEHPDGSLSDEIGVVSRCLHDGIVVEVSGEVDLATAPAVEQALLEAEESGGVVALDLTRTLFMDSTGLRVIITANGRLRERGGRLVVVQGGPQIRRLFELTRVADHVELIDDATELERTVAACK